MASPKRRAILHIGTEKTGSSSIQSTLQAVRDDLPDHGFAYARCMGDRNHIRLALYGSMGEGAGGDRSLARYEDRVSGRAASIARWLPEALAEEVSALPAGVRTVVFSSEHCHSRLRGTAGVRAIQALLEPHFDAYEVIVYLRRQDEAAVSRYTTLLRAGNDTGEVLNLRREAAAAYYDYAGLLDRWGEVFGRGALRPRIFARAELADGDVVRDILGLLGLAALPVPEQKTAQNIALSAEAQAFLRRFNAAYDRQKQAGRPRELMRFLGRRFSGRGLLPSRAEAEAFLARFAAGNERIRREFFPGRGSLFGGDFDRYPETVEPVTEDAVRRVAQTVVEHLAALPPRRRERNPELPAVLAAAREVVRAA